MAVQRAEDRILRARVAIMGDQRFTAMSGLLMVGTWSVSETFPTAATNGRDVIFGRKFIDSVDDTIVRFTVLHEYFHNMFMHLSVWKHLFEEHPKLANYATDIVINNMLDNTAGSKADGFLKVWEHAFLDHQYDGMDTGEVYRSLKKQAQQQQQQGGKGKSQGGVPKGANGQQGQDFDEHDTSGGGELEELTAEEVKELQQQIDNVLRQGALIAGKIGANVDRAVQGLLEVVVDWRDVLKDFVRTYTAGNDMATWRKPSRRWMAQNVYMPSHFSESTKRITIGVDTSGSIGEDQLRRALSEIKCACETVRPEIVDVIYWDYDVAAHELYEGDAVDTMIDATKPKGGGGTRVGAMLDYMNAKDIKPDCIVIFTDGYVEQDWGGTNWPAPVLWCISTKGVVAPHGTSLYVPADWE